METIDNIITHYKTSIPGAIALVLVVLNVTHVITVEELTAGATVLTAAGLLAAKDA